jgi:hypothetical protein
MSAQIRHPEFTSHVAERLTKHFEAISLSRNFNEEFRKRLLRTLANLKASPRVKESLTRDLIEAANAIALDRRVPKLLTRKLQAGDRVTLQFPGVVSLAFTGAVGSGTISLKAQNGLPASVEGFEPGWPIGTYNFGFTGKLSKGVYVDVSFDVGDMLFDTGVSSSLHILQWDGKSYKNITTHFDIQKKRVIGRTDTLSSFVIMSVSRSRTAKGEKH